VLDRPPSPFTFQAVGYALTVVDVFKVLPSSEHARRLGVDVDHLTYQYYDRMFAARGGANTPFWQRWTAASSYYWHEEDTVSWAERFLRQEFALFCQQTDPQAQERDQILHGLCHAQTGESAPSEVIVRIHELCFFPRVIFPWVLAHAEYTRLIRDYNRGLRKSLDELDQHLAKLRYFFINHPAASMLTERIACLRQLSQEADASFPNIDAWKKQLGLDKKLSLQASRQRIWTPLFKELVDLLRPFCRGPKHAYLAETPKAIPEQAFRLASRLMHLACPELWQDQYTSVKARYHSAPIRSQ
jgi:hypothetical protein